MNVSFTTLIGSVDIDELGKEIIKSVKPGFGYLTRICEFVRKFMK